MVLIRNREEESVATVWLSSKYFPWYPNIKQRKAEGMTPEVPLPSKLSDLRVAWNTLHNVFESTVILKANWLLSPFNTAVNFKIWYWKFINIKILFPQNFDFPELSRVIPTTHLGDFWREWGAHKRTKCCSLGRTFTAPDVWRITESPGVWRGRGS